MKARILKATVPACIICITLMGCDPVVTDINAILGSSDSNAAGIPVQYNPDYVEVSIEDILNDSKEISEEVSEEITENNDTIEDKDQDITQLAVNDTDEPDTDETLSQAEGEDEEEEEITEENTDEENGEPENASVIPEEFDAEFYAATYPDVVAVFGDSPETLYKHYLEYGKAEGRSCNAQEYALLNETSPE